VVSQAPAGETEARWWRGDTLPFRVSKEAGMLAAERLLPL